MRIVSWMYLFKNYTVKDWVSFCEVYGMPLRIGKYDPGASEADKQELLDAIVRIGSDAAGIIPETTMIRVQGKPTRPPVQTSTNNLPGTATSRSARRSWDRH